MADGYDRVLYQTYLSQVPMFASCSTEQLDRIAELGDAVAAPDGTQIVKEGDEGDGFYIVTSGKAVVDRSGREIASLGSGQYFGELALFDPAPRNATVTASGMVSLVRLRRDAFKSALDEMPAIRDALLHGMAHRLHQLDAQA
jgi:CRP-like cAMP-binding protein